MDRLGFFFGVWFSGIAEKKLFREKDCSKIVIDEFAGYLVAVVGFVSTDGWFYPILGLILFRVLDMWKPFPIYFFEKLPGGWGIMLDDLAAGVLTQMVLQILFFFLGPLCFF